MENFFLVCIHQIEERIWQLSGFDAVPGLGCYPRVVKHWGNGIIVIGVEIVADIV
jgi:hypothetical protein